MKIRTDPQCIACGEEEEAELYHFLGECYAHILARYPILGTYLMEHET